MIQKNFVILIGFLNSITQRLLHSQITIKYFCYLFKTYITKFLTLSE